jgi:hypothetical protein
MTTSRSNETKPLKTRVWYIIWDPFNDWWDIKNSKSDILPGEYYYELELPLMKEVLPKPINLGRIKVAP